MVGSDGLWDLWEYKDVLEYPLAAGVDVETSLKQLVEVRFVVDAMRTNTC